MADRSLEIGPVALTNTYTTNILNPAAAGSGTGYTPTASYITIRALHVANKTSAPATFRLFKGLTGANTAGTELFYDQTVAGFSSFDSFVPIKLAAADFLVGGASAGTTLTLSAFGEVGLA